MECFSELLMCPPQLPATSPAVAITPIVYNAVFLQGSSIYWCEALLLSAFSKQYVNESSGSEVAGTSSPLIDGTQEAAYTFKRARKCSSVLYPAIILLFRRGKNP